MRCCNAACLRSLSLQAGATRRGRVESGIGTTRRSIYSCDERPGRGRSLTRSPSPRHRPARTKDERENQLGGKVQRRIERDAQSRARGRSARSRSSSARRRLARPAGSRPGLRRSWRATRSSAGGGSRSSAGGRGSALAPRPRKEQGRTHRAGAIGAGRGEADERLLRGDGGGRPGRDERGQLVALEEEDDGEREEAHMNEAEKAGRLSASATRRKSRRARRG